MATTKQKLIQYINENLINNAEPISEDTDLLKSGLVDSLAIVRLVAYVEKEFTIVVSATELTLENFSSVNAISDYLDAKGQS